MNKLPFEVYNQQVQSNKTHALYPTTHSLIKHYSNRFKDYYRNASGSKRLIKLMKTNNFNKFYNKRQEWDRLSSNIPIEYFEALGITENLLATAVEIDQEIYDKKIEEPFTYSGFTHPVHRFIIQSYSFKYPLQEREAVERIKEMLIEGEIGHYNKQTCFILDRSPYYKLCIKDEGEEWFIKNRPDYRIINKQYEFELPSSLGFRV